jgi:hypothetical protein
MFGVILAVDKAYAPFARLALHSLRRYNASLPIQLVTCGIHPSLSELAVKYRASLRVIPRPSYLDLLSSLAEQQIAWTRAAKLQALVECPFDPGLYLDADTVAFTDIQRITEVAPNDLSTQDIFLLLRRPRAPDVYRWRRPYVHGSDYFSPAEIVRLINHAFEEHFTERSLERVRCWNGGVVFGAQLALRRLGLAWLERYEYMLTSNQRERFLPKDQLCLWLAAEHLQAELYFHELPLEWNYMIRHVWKEQAGDFELKDVLNLAGQAFYLLHLGDVKYSPWVSDLMVWFEQEEK